MSADRFCLGLPLRTALRLPFRLPSAPSLTLLAAMTLTLGFLAPTAFAQAPAENDSNFTARPAEAQYEQPFATADAAAAEAIVDESALTSAGDKLTNLFDTMTGLFSRGDVLAQPEHLITALTQLSGLWALVLLVVGGLTMFNGYRWYKLVTVALALLLGSLTGYWLGKQIGGPMVLAGCFGMLMGVAAWPLMKYAVVLFGGLAGAFVGSNAWAGVAGLINQRSTAEIPVDTYWIGGLIGLILLGTLAFLLFKLSVVMFTSVSGATMAVLGAIALLLGHGGFQVAISENLTQSNMTLPMVVFIAAAIGLVIQQANWSNAGTVPDDS